MSSKASKVFPTSRLMHTKRALIAICERTLRRGGRRWLRVAGCNGATVNRGCVATESSTLPRFSDACHGLATSSFAIGKWPDRCHAHPQTPRCCYRGISYRAKNPLIGRAKPRRPRGAHSKTVARLDVVPKMCRARRPGDVGWDTTLSPRCIATA